MSDEEKGKQRPPLPYPEEWVKQYLAEWESWIESGGGVNPVAYGADPPEPSVRRPADAEPEAFDGKSNRYKWPEDRK